MDTKRRQPAPAEPFGLGAERDILGMSGFKSAQRIFLAQPSVAAIQVVRHASIPQS
jgi:hypothetical protein